MITMPDLQTALLDLLHELRDSEIKLIIGGGFGLYLKTEHVRRLGARTLLREWPEARSTMDLDLFLRPELLIESTKLRPMARALSILGYHVIAGAEKYQFFKPRPGGGEEGGIKIDLLTGPQSRFQDTSAKADDRRVRPKPSVDIHAHPVDEAPTLEQGLLEVTLGGEISTGEQWNAEIFLPHPYTFLMMKLFAFRDRFDDNNKDFGRYHALDMYTIMATTMEEEWVSALRFRDEFKEEPFVVKAGQLVSEYFADQEDMGIIRMKESPYYTSELQVDEFKSALGELFSVWRGSLRVEVK